MKRAAVHVGVAVASVVGLGALADATQNRPDERVAGSVTEVAFTVSTRDHRHGDAGAAAALWAVCAGTVPGDVSPAPAERDGVFEVTVRPAIGEHGENRLVGCLEDATLDRVLADVVTVRSGLQRLASVETATRGPLGP